MPVETPSLFTQVIQEHIELKRQNPELEGDMPSESYETDDPFDNHPLFKSEEQARLEETMDGTEPAIVMADEANPWPGEDTLDPIASPRGRRPLGPLPRLRLGRLQRGGARWFPHDPNQIPFVSRAPGRARS